MSDIYGLLGVKDKADKDALIQGLLSAGLGMLANTTQPYGASPLAGIGLGGLQGVQAYGQARETGLANARLQLAMEEMQARVAAGKARQGIAERKEQQELTRRQQIENFVSQVPEAEQQYARLLPDDYIKSKLRPAASDPLTDTLQTLKEMSPDDPDRQFYEKKRELLTTRAPPMFQFGSYSAPQAPEFNAEGALVRKQYPTGGGAPIENAYEPPPLPISGKAQEAIVANNKGMARIQEAIAAVKTNPSAFGEEWYDKIRNYAGGTIASSTDPKGVPARALVSDTSGIKRHDMFGGAFTALESGTSKEFIPELYEAPQAVIDKLTNYHRAFERDNEEIIEFLKAQQKPGGILKNLPEPKKPGLLDIDVTEHSLSAFEKEAARRAGKTDRQPLTLQFDNAKEQKRVEEETIKQLMEQERNRQ